MQHLHKSVLSIVVASSIALGGCNATSPNKQSSNFEKAVKPVATEYSNLLSCVGDLIDKSDKPQIVVHIRDIDDETVPHRFRDRRLSKGGAWWFQTAISKMETDKIVTTINRPNKEQRNSVNYLELTGAWTQDDTEIGVNSQNIGFNNLGGGILDKFGWFNREETSVIAGDFVSSRNGQVIHATAISLAVAQSGTDYEMRIEDGSRRFDFGLSSETNEGPQFAQRRIAEAATLVHIANAFSIDYASCVEALDNSLDNELLDAFLAATEEEQAKKMQVALANGGYYSGELDGVWGNKSRTAMKRFELEQQLMPTGVPSSHAYSVLITARVRS